MGFLYAVQRDDDHTDVFIGGYSSENEALKVVEKLKSKGYTNAFVADLNVEGGKSETVIQLATKRAGDKIDWEKYVQAGELYVLLNGKQVKLMAGGFESMGQAKAQLSKIKKLGFKDAFVKNVNNALLHKVGAFETGGVDKKPLIPLDFGEKEDVAENKKTTVKPDARPISHDAGSIIVPKSAEVEIPVLTAKGGQAAKPKKVANKEPAFEFKAKLPDIRAKVKRTSAIELQKVLKAEGAYKGALDGYYGKGTRNAYELVLNNNRQLKKYSILAKYEAIPGTDAHIGSLQQSINSLWQDPQTALDQLEKSKAPIAKAYRAYFLFATDGPSFEVNTLMNEAIKEAAKSDLRATLPVFDPYATYDYRDLKQLLTHMRYIHETTNEDVNVPCWLFRRHPGTALKAFGEIDGIKSSLSMQTCGGFWEWQEVQLLHAIASDLCTANETSEGKIASSQTKLAQLYLAPQNMGWKERKALMDWNDKVWKGIDGWATRDPLLEEIATALKISYFQTQVLLEDYFMDEGYDEKNSKGLALATLKALVGHHFERFI